jgi:hypothetical protein
MDTRAVGLALQVEGEALYTSSVRDFFTGIEK